MKIYLATWTEDNQGETLSKAGVEHRLMSYYFLKEAKESFLPQYVKEGKVMRGKDESKN
jgi:hypothetical protein